MAQNVDVKGLQFVGPDGKTVLCPSWDFIIDELSKYITRINSSLTSINADLVEMNTTINTWPKKEVEEVNNNG